MSVQFWVLVAFLVLVFLTGGGSRADIQSLLVLRPAAVLACGIGFCTLSSQHVASYRLLFILAAAAFILVVIHLAPFHLTYGRACQVMTLWRMPIALPGWGMFGAR